MLDSGEPAGTSFADTMNLPRERGHGIEGVGADVFRPTCEPGLDPVLVEGQQAEVGPDHRAEAVHVRVACASPVDELDAELERALRPADEIRLVDAQQVVEGLDVRDRRLADADRGR